MKQPDRHLEECLKGTESRQYILPFFWQHGESHERLREEIDAIERSNIQEFCVESRTHEQFCRDQWWEDFGFILSEARRRNMYVWLLDDKRFPTGYANGYLKDHPEHKRILLKAEWRDFAGPMPGTHMIPVQLKEGESYVAVTAYQRVESGNALIGEGIDLTDHLQNGLLTWDVPEGFWRIYYIIRTPNIKDRPEWIDMMSRESCMAMIHAVYEPQFAHFAEYFGNTFKGFFSDEPAFCNILNAENYDARMGTDRMPLPWNDDMVARMAASLGMDPEDVRKDLPMLFHPHSSPKMHALRCHYMDQATKQYSENFTRLLGEWCEAHGVQYIGHIIEDENSHQRLGVGPGHFYRALQYEHMSGMDIVLHQIVPGMTEIDHSASVMKYSTTPEFFNYYLAKMAVSLGHLSPRMQGRTMCEIFGAFGWAEGIPYMKQLTDHMIANGINYYVPHAFSPKFPDPDCPPHFYAGGSNPQFEAFGQLMNYMRRCAHLVSGGRHIAPAALLYTAEAEWSCGELSLGQKAAKELTRAHLDFDLVWEDILPEITVKNGLLQVGPESFRALVIPSSQYLPAAMLAQLERIASEGGTILAEGRLPVSVEKGEVLGAHLALCSGDCGLSNIHLVEEGQAADWMCKAGMQEITLQPQMPLVRYFHMVREEKNTWFFSSEDIFHEADFTVRLPEAKTYRIYDPWTNSLTVPQQQDREIRIRLPKNGAIFVVEDDRPAPAFDYGDGIAQPAYVQQSVSIDGKMLDIRPGEDLALREGFAEFCGTITYEGRLTLDGTEKALCLGKVGEIAHVVLGGQDLGYAVCEPYTFRIDQLGLQGEISVTIRVASNLGYRGRDFFSTFVPLPPIGLIGPVTVR